MAGENADADIEKAEDFIVNVLPGLIEGYAAEDIYNADETGVFFKSLPDKLYGFNNEKCHGGKKSKDRLTVMVFCNMTGTDWYLRSGFGMNITLTFAKLWEHSRKPKKP
jgi:hypothetical protein